MTKYKATLPLMSPVYIRISAKEYKVLPDDQRKRMWSASCNRQLLYRVEYQVNPKIRKIKKLLEKQRVKYTEQWLEKEVIICSL